MKMEQSVPETSAYKIQTPGNYPEESIQHSQHDESLKSSIHILSLSCLAIKENTVKFIVEACLTFQAFSLESTSPTPADVSVTYCRFKQRTKPAEPRSSDVTTFHITFIFRALHVAGSLGLENLHYLKQALRLVENVEILRGSVGGM
jgi:hypothetical protein